jgi:AraC-like DNA-binding protein
MSAERLRRLCLYEFDQTPMDRVRSLRMTRAATLLRRTQDKVDHLAQELGYASVYSFSAAFKAVFGVSPSKYRSPVAIPI